MQDGKGKIDRLVRWFKKTRLVRWFKKRDVSIRYLILFVVLILPTIIWNVKNIYFGTFEIDDGSARYLLSALLQSQAAIIAIVVTMTLVAVQLTASAYSPRVIDIFRNDRVMWMLLVWYGLSMFFGVFVLETIGSEYSNLNPWGITVSLEFYVFLAYLMGIVAFAGLFWHVGNVINFLKPKNIIKKLSEEITGEKVSDFIKSKEKQREDRTESAKDDPVQPIVDIIRGSVMKYDIAITEYGLKAITYKATEVVNLKCQEDISRYFCSHLSRIGKLAVSIGDGESVIKVLESLKSFEESTAKERPDFVVLQAAEFLGGIGISAIEKGLEDAAEKAAKFLEDVGKTATEKELEDAAENAAASLRDVRMAATKKGLEGAAENVVWFLGGIGKIAAEKGLRGAAWQAAASLGGVGISAAEKGFGDETLRAVWSLGGIGKTATEKGLEGAAWQAAASLGGVGMSAAEKGFEGATELAIESLRDIEKIASEKGLDFVANQATASLGGVGMSAAEKGFEDVTLRAVRYLRYIGISAAIDGFEDATEIAIESLGGIGKIAAEKGLEGATEIAIESLGDIGRIASRKGFLDAIPVGAARFLAELTISNERITKTAIQNYESQLQEQDRDPFRKFMRMYKQELEKLRAGKSE